MNKKNIQDAVDFILEGTITNVEYDAHREIVNEMNRLPDLGMETEAAWLKIPFRDKDLAKKWGARWHPDHKTWYWPSGQGPLPDALSQYRV